MLLGPTLRLLLPPMPSRTLTLTPNRNTRHSMRFQSLLQRQNLDPLVMKKSLKLLVLKETHQLQPLMATQRGTQIQLMPMHSTAAIQIPRQATLTPMTRSRRMDMILATMAMIPAASPSTHRLVKARLQARRLGWLQTPQQASLAPLQAPQRKRVKLKMGNQPSLRRLLCKSSCPSSTLRSSKPRRGKKRSVESKSSCDKPLKQKLVGKQLLKKLQQQLHGGLS